MPDETLPDSPSLEIRRLVGSDLPAALAIQSQSYPPFLVEPELAFASRLDAAAPYCLAAVLDGELVGYLLAHAWPGGSVPALGVPLPRDVTGDALFIHDLSVGPAGRGHGIGARLVDYAFAAAIADGMYRAELVAVEGAASYWATLGFVQTEPPPHLIAKVAEYGEAARWMTRALA